MRLDHLMLFFCSLLCMATAATAQQNASSSCDIPLVVTRFVSSSGTVEAVQNLGPQDLAVQLQAVPSAVESVSIDNGAKRVALVLDASSSVPDEEWKLEAAMTTVLANDARSEDRFALLLVGAENSVVTLLSPAEVVERVRNWRDSRPAVTDPGEKTYDTLFAAASSLNPPVFGDSVFMFGHYEDSGSKTDPAQLRDLLLKNRTRFYGVSFQDPFRNGPPPTLDQNGHIHSNRERSKLEQFSADTGYYFGFEQVIAMRQPGQLQIFEEQLLDLYNAIAAPYRLKIPMTGAAGPLNLQVSLRRMEERHIIERDVHYPKFIYPCDTTTPATASVAGATSPEH